MKNREKVIFEKHWLRAGVGYLPTPFSSNPVPTHLAVIFE